MKVLKNQLSGKIKTLVEDSFDKKYVVFNKKGSSYINISMHIEVYIPEKSTKDSTVKNLPWVHVAIHCPV